MRESYPRKKPGSRLGAGLINKLTKLAKRLDTPSAGSFTYKHENTTVGMTPWIQTLFRIESDRDGEQLQLASRMYYDVDTSTWVVDSATNQVQIDTSAFGVDSSALAIGDIVSAWWHTQRGTYIAETSRPAATAPPVDPNVPPVVDTSCCSDCPEGVDLPGNPTVCCKGHLLIKFIGWPFLTEHKLKFKSADEWATDPFVGPECDLGSSVTAQNIYRWLMRPSRTAGESVLVLELVTNNGCPLICIEYRMVKAFVCTCSNLFYLYDWKNVQKKDIHPDFNCEVCLNPVADAILTPALAMSCITRTAGLEVDVPGAFEMTMAGADGYQFNNCIAAGTDGNTSALALKTGSLPVTCVGGTSTIFIDVNRRYQMPIAPNSNFGGSSTGLPTGAAGQWLCGLGGPDVGTCARYGLGVGDGYPVGWVCAGSDSGVTVPAEKKTYATLYLNSIGNYGGDADVVGIQIVVYFEIPYITFYRTHPTGAHVYLLYKSDVFTFNISTLNQSDIDAIFDQIITLTKCDEIGCDFAGVVGDLSDLTIPDAITVKSMSSPTLIGGSATDSGSCGAGCVPDDADVGESDDADPGGCCIDGVLFRELTEAECTEVGGAWYPDIGTGAEECEGTDACCLDTNCIMATAAVCLDMGGDPQGNGTNCDHPNQCGDTTSQSASSVSSVSSQSASSASSQSASSVSSVSSESESVSSASSSSSFGACCVNIVPGSDDCFGVDVNCTCEAAASEAACEAQAEASGASWNSLPCSAIECSCTIFDQVCRADPI